ncbi:Mu transposase C-terminal domain-containing protein [Streptomyces sp. YIM S03343]
MRFKSRDYVADWMTGQAGREVMVRFMPHHTHEIEICDLHGRRLGTAHLADQATPEQLDVLRRSRTRRAQRLKADAKPPNNCAAIVSPQPPRRPQHAAWTRSLQPRRHENWPSTVRATSPSWRCPI